MPKQVIEPQIVEPGQIAQEQEQTKNNSASFRFYHAKSGGCLGFIVFIFVSVFVAIPLLIISLFRKKK